ncbi:uncharacterized protein [Cherax quadricarinatus]|uniref:uncharacterized protein isoform X2 n=1 Tax=Cherax quadricarinatus TaxID=27406 RepID=UPI00387E68ED
MPQEKYRKKSMNKKKTFRNFPRLRKSSEVNTRIKQEREFMHGAIKRKYGAKRRYDMTSARILPEETEKSHNLYTALELLRQGMEINGISSDSITTTFKRDSSGLNIAVLTPNELNQRTFSKPLFFKDSGFDLEDEKNSGSNKGDNDKEYSTDNPLGGMSVKSLISKTSVVKDIGADEMPLKKYRKESLLKKNVFCDLRRLWNRIEFKAQIRKKRDHMSNTNKRKCGTRTKYDMTLSENLPEETIKDHEENTGKKLLRGVRKEINKSSDASITETFKANPSGLKKIIPAQSVLPHKPVFVNVLCLDPKNENGTRVNDDELSVDDPLVGVSGKTLFSNTSSINEAADFSGFEDDSPDIPDLLTKILRGRYRKKLVNKQAIRNSPRLRKLGEFTAHIKRKSEFISDTNKRKYETEKVIKRHERNTGKKLFRRAQNKIHKSGDASISKTFTTSPSYLNKMISEESIVPLKPVFVSVLCLDSKNKNGSNYNEDDDDELLTDDPLGGVSGKTLISKTLLMKDTADFSGTEEGSQDIIDPEVKKPRKNYGKKSLVKKKAFRNLPRLRKSLEFVAEIKQKNDANKIKHGAKRRYDMISTRILPEKAIKGHMANTSQELLSGVGMAFKETFSSTITKTFTTNSSGSTITIFTPKEIVPKTLFFDTLNMDSKVKNGGSNNEDDNNELSSDNPLGGMSMKTLIKKTPLTKDTAEFSGIEEESEHNVKMPHKKRRKKKWVRKKAFYNLRRLRKSCEFNAQVKQKNKLINDRNKRKYGTETKNLSEETARGQKKNTDRKLLRRVRKEIYESSNASITRTFATSSSGLKEVVSTESILPHKPLFIDVTLDSKNKNGSSNNEVDNDDKLSSDYPLGGMSVKTVFSKTSSSTKDIAETSGTRPGHRPGHRGIDPRNPLQVHSKYTVKDRQGIPDLQAKMFPKRIRDVSLVKMKAYPNLPILRKSSEFNAQIKPMSEFKSDANDRNLPEKINEGVCHQAQGHLANTSQELLSGVGMVFQGRFISTINKTFTTNSSGSTITIFTPKETSSKPLFFDTLNVDSKDKNGSSNNVSDNDELSFSNPLGGMSMKTLMSKTPLTKDTAEFPDTEEKSEDDVKMPHKKRRKKKLVRKKTFYNLRRLRKSHEFSAQVKQKNKLISDRNKRKYGTETRNLPEETAKGHMENTGKKLLSRVGKEINESGDASITTTFANSSSGLKEILSTESIPPHKPLFVDVLSLGSKNGNGSSDNEVDNDDLSSGDPLGGMSVKTIFSKTSSLTEDIAETSGTEGNSQGIPDCESKVPPKRIRDVSLVKMKAYSNLPILSKSSEFHAQIKPVSETPSDESDRNLPEKINEGVCRQAQGHLANTSQKLLSEVGMVFKETWSPNFTKALSTNLSGSTITILTPNRTSSKPLFFDTFNMDSKDENGSSNTEGVNELSSDNPLGGMSMKTLIRKTPLTKDTAEFSGTEEDSKYNVKMPHQKRRKEKLVVKKTFYNLRRLRKSREFGAQIKQKNKLISDTNKKKYGVETRNLPEETAKGHMENTGKKLLRRVGKEINKSGDASITTTFANSSSELKEIVPAESILPHKPLFVDVLSLGSKNENGSSDNEVDDEDLSSDDPLGGMSVKTIFSKTDSLTDDIAETSGTEEDSQGISHLETKMPLRRIRDLSLVKMKAYPNLPILSKSSEFSAQIKPLSELTSDASERNLPEKINDGVCHQAQGKLTENIVRQTLSS